MQALGTTAHLHQHHNQESIESAGLHGLRFLMPNHTKFLEKCISYGLRFPNQFSSQDSIIIAEKNEKGIEEKITSISCRNESFAKNRLFLNNNIIDFQPLCRALADKPDFCVGPYIIPKY